jgi:hypothetical protein
VDGGDLKLREALEEVREEFEAGAMVISSARDRPLEDEIQAAGDEREAWVEWGEVTQDEVSVPATHILFLDEDGYMMRDGSGMSVVSARDYARLGR